MPRDYFVDYYVSTLEADLLAPQYVSLRTVEMSFALREEKIRSAMEGKVDGLSINEE